MDDVLTLALLIVGVEIISGTVGFIAAKWYIRNSLLEVGDLLSGIFEKPTVKKAYSILGSKSAESRQESALGEQMALDVINSEKFAGIKLAAKGIGIDVDEYIEDHGAISTLKQASSLAGMLGINLEQVLSGNMTALNTSEHTISQTKNPYY